MSPEKETPANTSSRDTRRLEWIRPFEIAALAMAISIYRREQGKGGVAGTDYRTAPKDCIEDAYELLMEAEEILRRRHREYEKGKALEDYAKEAQLEKTYAWEEILTIQVKAPPGKGSLEKFCPGKNWRQRVADHKAGRLPFTNEDLVNRPAGFTMVGNLASPKSLRNAIKRYFGKSAQDIIAPHALSVEQINKILINQLMLYKGEMPKAKKPKINGG